MDYHLVHQGLEAPSLLFTAQSINGRQLCMRHAQLLELRGVLRYCCICARQSIKQSQLCVRIPAPQTRV